MSDSVIKNDPGSGRTQEDRPLPPRGPGHGVEHGPGPTEGPYVGEGAEDEEVVTSRHGQDATRDTPPA